MWKMEVQIYLGNYCHDPAGSSDKASNMIMSVGMDEKIIQNTMNKSYCKRRGNLKKKGSMISNLSFEGEVIEITGGKTILESRKNKFWFWIFKFNVPVEHSAYLEISICSSRERCNLEINTCEFSNY